MLARKALAGTAGAPKVYVEDVFSTYLIAGTNGSVAVNNGIDLSGKGGLVWQKNRIGSGSAGYHYLEDTARGAANALYSNLTNAQAVGGGLLVSGGFSSNGFTTYVDQGSSGSQVAWTFRKAKKFFDVVTYTGNGSNRTISHNLGSVPGSIFIKRTDTTGAWAVYHRSLANTEYLVLNTTAAKATGTTYWNSTTPTSTEFSLGTATDVNANGGTYVAYLFAHDAGGFGTAGTDNVITCGSFNNSTRVELGYEPQWIMCKSTSGTGSYWWTQDSMRSMSLTNTCTLAANLSDAETNWGLSLLTPDATGFTPTGFGEGNPYIFIAIRRGPMKTPTDATKVFKPVAYTGNSATRTITSDFTTDMVMSKRRNSANQTALQDRLRGAKKQLLTCETDAESSPTTGLTGFDLMTGITVDGSSGYWNTAYDYINWHFKRSPGFFDVVCYTGTGANNTINHNLGVAPELIILKSRSASASWPVWVNGFNGSEYTVLDGTSGKISDAPVVNFANIGSSSFQIQSTWSSTNQSGVTYVAYLFASVSGVSKVGSYTGNGSSVTVTTDFQPRFILVKRTDSTGNWIVGDSARGLVSADEPALFLNSNAAETTGQDWVDVSSTGFTVNETALNANVNTATYIYLCVA